MNFEINPCKACKEKYKNGDCDINTVNSCVAETAAAFAGIPSNNLIKNTTDANNNWSTCMEDMMAGMMNMEGMKVNGGMDMGKIEGMLKQLEKKEKKEGLVVAEPYKGRR